MLQMWTIYKRPADYPNSYVARLFEVDADGAKPTVEIMVSPRLDMIRSRMKGMGLVMLTRSPEDDPVIVETWL